MQTIDEIATRSNLLLSRYKELLPSFDNLENFSEAIQWDSDASSLIELFKNSISDFLEYQKSLQQELEIIKTERESKSFFMRSFSSKKSEKEHAESILDMADVVKKTEIIIEKLQDLIDRTPNSKVEQKEMLNELKTIKKNLALEKREINESIRKVNVEARKSISKVTGISGGIFGTVARAHRVSVRYQKEAALRPNEDAKAGINRQLLQVEKDILWVSKFNGDEIPIINNIIRCAYCGRRVIDGNPCQSCGSIQTILGPS
jgi:hypothetical protein